MTSQRTEDLHGRSVGLCNNEGTAIRTFFRTGIHAAPYPAGHIFKTQRSGTISTCAGNRKLVRLFPCETPRLLPLAVANRTFSYSPFSDRHSLYCSMYRCVSTQFGWCELYKIGFSITRRSGRTYRQCIDSVSIQSY